MRNASLPAKRLYWGTPLQRNLLGIAVVLLALVAWELVARAKSSIYIPPVTTIATTFVHEWFSSQFREHAIPSLIRMISGYCIASLLGVAVGVLIGAYRPLFRMLDPFLQFLRAIPPSAAFTKIGHSAPNAMTTIFIASPIPISRIPTGMIAEGGIARKNCRNGSSSRKTGRYAPISTPSATPSTVATA